jgi:ribonuclease P protein component
LIGRIQSRSAFVRIREEGRHVRSGPLSCTMLLDSSLLEPQVGYALGRSFGSAVRRNRLRRQMREVLRLRPTPLAPGIYVFGASPRANGLAYADVERHMESLIAKGQAQ